jgi:hypothetical protein
MSCILEKMAYSGKKTERFLKKIDYCLLRALTRRFYIEYNCELALTCGGSICQRVNRKTREDPRTTPNPRAKLGELAIPLRGMAQAFGKAKRHVSREP